MAASQADIDKLEAARVALVAGEKAQTVTFSAGGNTRTVTFYATKIEDLLRVLGDLRRELAAASGGGGPRFFSTSKGL